MSIAVLVSLWSKVEELSKIHRPFKFPEDFRTTNILTIKDMKKDM